MMIKFLNLTLRRIFVVLTAAVLFSGCEKEKRTSAEWGEMASAKRAEIQALSLNIACSEKNQVTIQEMTTGCSAQYFSILASDLTNYEKLKKEYLYFTDQQYAAWSREGIVVEPCHESIWVSEQPIKLECESDKVRLITSENVGLDEARPLADNSYEEIIDYAGSQTCTDKDVYTYTAIINYRLMKIEFIPYSRTADYKTLKEKISLYNRLAFRIVQDAGTGSNFQHEKQVQSVDCVGGKPVISFRN